LQPQLVLPQTLEIALLVTQLRDATLLLQYQLPLSCECLASRELLTILKSATVLILAPIIVVVV
jgi:hypothetical protein